MRLPADLSSAVQGTIDRYQLIDPGEEIALAFSGGKDSIGLCLCLRELGYNFRAITVDMGYEAGWASRIEALASALGMAVEIISVRGRQRTSISISDRAQIRKRLDVLDSIRPGMSTGTVTPCTHCYSSKVIALDNAVRAYNISKIAFAHHMTDACASLLKEALFRIDRNDRGHSVYHRSHFESLVQELASEAVNYQATGGELTRRITELARDRRVDTDEPARQQLRLDGKGVDIIRPLLGTWEPVLTRLSKQLSATPEGSGCGHGATANTETPREMVHYRVLGSASAQFSDHVASLVLSGIRPDGRAMVRARYRREQDLGAGYKASTVSDKL